MQELEVRFLDQYKRLDVLCGDLLSCHNGVSTYIAQMEQVSPRKRQSIASWEADFRTLKHLRWLRNKITHETGISDCQAEDIEAAAAFYDRILSRQDSLALLYKREHPLQREISNAPGNGEPKSGTSAGCLAWIAVAALAAFLIYFCTHYI